MGTACLHDELCRLRGENRELRASYGDTQAPGDFVATSRHGIVGQIGPPHRAGVGREKKGDTRGQHEAQLGSPKSLKGKLNRAGCSPY